MLGKHKQGLYYIANGHLDNKGNEESLLSFTGAIDLSKSDIWHLRLGHMPFEQIKHIKALSVLYDRPFSVCTTYAKAKHHRLPFHTSSIKSKVY